MKTFSYGKALGAVAGICHQGCDSSMGASTGHLTQQQMTETSALPVDGNEVTHAEEDPDIGTTKV